MGISEIVSGAAVILALTATWLKLFSSSKAAKAFDDSLKELQKICSQAKEKQNDLEKDIVRLIECQKQSEKENLQVKADILREAQVMTNQLEVVHKKIDHIDEKLDKIRDRQSK